MLQGARVGADFQLAGFLGEESMDFVTIILSQSLPKMLLA